MHINTKDQKVVSVCLINDSKNCLKEINEYGSQVLLKLIKKILKKNSFQDIKGVEVEIGPGSYTGIRVGLAVANALGFALNIPVNGKRLETELRY